MAPTGGVPVAAELKVGVLEPHLWMRVPAFDEALPLVRQTVQAFGLALGAAHEGLDKSIIAVTEAAANSIRHAYDSDGDVEIRMRAAGDELIVTVSDRGRGLRRSIFSRLRRSRRPRLGMPVIEGLADAVEFRDGAEGGTDVAMSFRVPGVGTTLVAPPLVEPFERSVRRLVAVLAAQADMPVDELTNALLVAELAARHTPAYVLGDTARASLSRLPGGFSLTIGPFAAGDAKALIAESDLPSLGPVLMRLSENVTVVPSATDPSSEDLLIRLGSG
jgi:anti-sigma regulatory factor (Ser/Thr protein kinase)